MDEGSKAGDIGYRDSRDSVVKLVSLIAGVDDPQVVQLQVIQGDQHRTPAGGSTRII